MPAFLFGFPRPESLWSFLCVALTAVHISWAAVSPRPVEMETCWYSCLSSIFLSSCNAPIGVHLLLFTLCSFRWLLSHYVQFYKLLSVKGRGIDGRGLFYHNAKSLHFFLIFKSSLFLCFIFFKHYPLCLFTPGFLLI